MQLHRRQHRNHILPVALVALPVISMALMTQPIQPAASPSSYPTITSSTAPYNGVTAQNIRPTAIPELRHRHLRRQESDSLGWNDPKACNIGVCSPTDHCTVLASESPQDSIVTGACCAPGTTCDYHTTCMDYTSHTMSTVSNAVILNGTAFCGSVYSSCASLNIAYGYGLGTLLWQGCDSYSREHYTTNALWILYRDETNPAKGPMPTTTFTKPSSSSSNSSPSTSAVTLVAVTPTASGGGHPSMPVGAIAGIAIGGVVVVVLGVVAVLVVWSKLRKPKPPTEVMTPFQPKVPLSPVPAYTSSMWYPSPQQPEAARHQGPVWEADSGLRIDTQPVWPAAQLRGQ